MDQKAIYGPKPYVAQKVCSRANFEKRFGAIESGESEDGASRGHRIRKKFPKTFFKILFRDVLSTDVLSNLFELVPLSLHRADFHTDFETSRNSSTFRASR